jgi:hypothetical protein
MEFIVFSGIFHTANGRTGDAGKVLVQDLKYNCTNIMYCAIIKQSMKGEFDYGKGKRIKNIRKG